MNANRSTAQAESYSLLQGVLFNFTVATRNYHCGTAQGEHGLTFVGITPENREKYLKQRRILMNAVREFDRAYGLEDEL